MFSLISGGHKGAYASETRSVRKEGREFPMIVRVAFFCCCCGKAAVCLLPLGRGGTAVFLAGVVGGGTGTPCVAVLGVCCAHGCCCSLSDCGLLCVPVVLFVRWSVLWSTGTGLDSVEVDG